MSQQRNSKPIKDFRAGTISAAVFRNEVQQEGNTTIRYSVKIQKQFRKDDGQWQNTDYYFPDDLPKLQLVADKAFEFVSLKESKDAEDSAPV